MNILPCPFCGSHEVSISHSVDLDDVPASRYVECHKCAAMGPETKPYAGNAVKKWNGRAELDQLHRQLEESQKELGEARDKIVTAAWEYGKAKERADTATAAADRLRGDRELLMSVYHAAVNVCYHAKRLREKDRDGVVSEITGTSALDMALKAFENRAALAHPNTTEKKD